jgi:Tfp pilus assembly protein FimT
MMTFPTGKPARVNNPARQSAFTLVELILVMALLIIAVSMVTAKMSAFFGARGVDSETRRFLALVHYGQSRAVSEAIPMMLWIDVNAQKYGLQQEPGYSDVDKHAQEFVVDPDLRIDSMNGIQAPATTPSGIAAVARAARSLPAIHFAPDGAISQPSIAAVTIRKGSDQPVYIVQTANKLSYEIADQNTAMARLRR